MRSLYLSEIRKNPVLLASTAVLLLFIAVAAAAPLIAPHDPNAQNLLASLEPPSATNWLGSDEYGRDLLSRICFGVRSSMIVGGVVVLVSGVIGTFLGILAGFLGGLLDEAVMRVSDVMMAFPSLVLALGLIAALGPGLTSTIIALTVAFAPIYARIVRGNVLGIKQEAYIEAARTIGVPKHVTMTRHVLPNVLGAVLVQGALTFAFAVLSEAGLSFVGLGVPPPTASLGNIIASGRDYIIGAPWITTAAGVAIMLVVLALLVIADGLRDVVDPYHHRL
jgi:peptide/nickel transport system permease protein